MPEVKCRINFRTPAKLKFLNILSGRVCSAGMMSGRVVSKLAMILQTEHCFAFF